MHVGEVRVRDPLSVSEPWARLAMRAGGYSVAEAASRVDELRARYEQARAANTPGGRLALAAQSATGVNATRTEKKGRKRKRGRSSSSGKSSEDSQLFRSGSSRKGIGFIREIARDHPGALYEKAVRSIASKMGERVGPQFNLAQPRVASYLNSVVLVKYPKLSTAIARELRTLAESLDELANGGVAQAADLLMQRFKALEKSLESGGSWKLARHLEITRDEDTLVSVEEELAAAKEQLNRAKLTEGNKQGR